MKLLYWKGLDTVVYNNYFWRIPTNKLNTLTLRITNIVVRVYIALQTNVLQPEFKDGV